MTTEITAPGFDYSQLSEADQQFAQDAASIIHQIRGQAVVQIGEQLVAVKARLPRQYGAWLKAEFSWSERSARSFVDVYERFGKTANFAEIGRHIAKSAQYLLAAPSTPQAARDEAIEEAQANRPVTHAKAKAIVDKHRPKRLKTRPLAAPYQETRPYYDNETGLGRYPRPETRRQLDRNEMAETRADQ